MSELRNWRISKNGKLEGETYGDGESGILIDASEITDVTFGNRFVTATTVRGSTYILSEPDEFWLERYGGDLKKALRVTLGRRFRDDTVWMR